MAVHNPHLTRTWLPEDTEDTTNPSYYKALPKDVEVYEIIEAVLNRDLGFTEHISYSDLGHVLRYALRLGIKNGSLQELKKIQWYLEKLIAREEALDAKDTTRNEEVSPMPTGATRASWVPEADYPDESD